jgi:hypothetical protein
MRNAARGGNLVAQIRARITLYQETVLIAMKPTRLQAA